MFDPVWRFLLGMLVCWLVCFVLLCFALFCFVLFCLFVCLFPHLKFFLGQKWFSEKHQQGFGHCLLFQPWLIEGWQHFSVMLQIIPSRNPFRFGTLWPRPVFAVLFSEASCNWVAKTPGCLVVGKWSIHLYESGVFNQANQALLSIHWVKPSVFQDSAQSGKMSMLEKCHELARPIIENFALGEMALVNCCPVIFMKRQKTASRVQHVRHHESRMVFTPWIVFTPQYIYDIWYIMYLVYVYV